MKKLEASSTAFSFVRIIETHSQANGEGLGGGGAIVLVRGGLHARVNRFTALD